MTPWTAARQLSQTQDVATKVAMVLRKRTTLAQEHFAERLRRAVDPSLGALMGEPPRRRELWSDWYSYAVDAAQRSILFWDTLRQRGNNFVEHTRAGPAAGAALRLRDGASTAARSSGRSTTRWCASCRPKA